MAKILQKYVKFSTKELEQYAANPESCVHCLKSDLHISMGPYGLGNFKHAVHELLIRTKVGMFDANLNGIVLGIKNIKILGQTAGLRADDPTLHLVINADFYVLRPHPGAVLHGVVRHVSHHQISAIIYRVFNTTIRFTNKKQCQAGIKMDQDIKFRIKDLNLSSQMPYIEGELLLDDSEVQNTVIKFEDGAEETEAPVANGNTEYEDLDALLDLIKEEPIMKEEEEEEEPEEAPKKTKKRKSTVGEADISVSSHKKSKKIKIEKI